MRHVAILLAALILVGCDTSPSPDEVSKAVSERLQAQLDHDYATQHASVQKVEVVKLVAPKYEGNATIAVNETTITISVAVTSDGKTTIVSIDDQKLQAAFQTSMERRLTALNGKYSDYVFTSSIFALFPDSLKAAKEDFSRRLEVLHPITSDNDYYVGSGCTAHQCGSNEAVWTIDKHTGVAAAIVMKEIPARAGGMPAHINFHLYGVSTENLPPPLAAWAIQNGMNMMNVVADVPQYQAPPK